MVGKASSLVCCLPAAHEVGRGRKKGNGPVSIPGGRSHGGGFIVGEGTRVIENSEVRADWYVPTLLASACLVCSTWR